MKALVKPVEVAELVAALGGELRGDPHTSLNRLASFKHADVGSISFITGDAYKAALAESKASVVIMPPAYAECFRGTAILTDNPYLYYARLTQWWKKRMQEDCLTSRIAASAVIHPSAEVSDTAIVGEGAVIDAYARISDQVYIGANVFIGAHSSVGADSFIAAQVTILHGCHIGKRTILNSGVVIGGDGLGFAKDGAHWVKIEQLGGVRIGDDVEIGANTCVDRGAIDDTVIGNGVKLDNLIQIAHNVHVGDDTIMASCVGISGSTHVGKRCVIGGAVGMAGHLEITDDVVVMAATNVTKSITKSGVYSGIIPFDEANAWRKNAAMLRHLDHMRERIRELEKQVAHFTTTDLNGKTS